jgi:hypothetical protein
MERIRQKRQVLFVICLLLLCVGLLFVHAALLDLDAFVTFTIFDNTGIDPLPFGSLVYIIGSGDAIAHPMDGQGTNLVAGSTTGDDVILGIVRIGDNNSSNGTFTTTVQYNPDEISYVYIRFFEWTNPVPVTGLVFWGTSAIFELVPTLGVARVDFNPDQTLAAQNYNNFIVIPEPGTANLLILFLGMLGGLRSRARRQERSRRLSAGSGGPSAIGSKR